MSLSVFFGRQEMTTLSGFPGAGKVGNHNHVQGVGWSLASIILGTGMVAAVKRLGLLSPSRLVTAKKMVMVGNIAALSFYLLEHHLSSSKKALPTSVVLFSIFMRSLLAGFVVNASWNALRGGCEWSRLDTALAGAYALPNALGAIQYVWLVI